MVSASKLQPYEMVFEGKPFPCPIGHETVRAIRLICTPDAIGCYLVKIECSKGHERTVGMTPEMVGALQNVHGIPILENGMQGFGKDHD